MVKNAIKVYARLKPERNRKRLIDYRVQHQLQKDQFNEDVLLLITSQKSLEYIDHRPESWNFSFFQVFEETTKQDDIFKIAAEPVVQSILEGYNGTIFAYGQTGSGKTYTITGDPTSCEDHGVIPRTLRYIFEVIKKHPENVYSVEVAYLEIYNENGYDLLDRKQRRESITRLEDLPRVTIQEDEAGKLHLKNLTFHRVENERDAFEMLLVGDTNRITADTPMNPQSSRSHCIFTIVISIKQFGANRYKRAKMHLVDLAGSERVYKCAISGTILTEAKHINLSLHYLEQVIVCLGQENISHIPYRNSLLTAILRDSLGGNCLTTMLATLSISLKNVEETVSTCRFAQRVALIRNDVNLVSENNIECENTLLKLENERLKKQIEEMSKRSGTLNTMEHNENLTESEKKILDTQIETFLESQNNFQWDGDPRKVQYCFQKLKEYSGHGKYEGAKKSSEYYKSVILQRDKEISALLEMLKKEKQKNNKQKDAVGHTENTYQFPETKKLKIVRKSVKEKRPASNTKECSPVPCNNTEINHSSAKLSLKKDNSSHSPSTSCFQIINLDPLEMFEKEHIVNNNNKIASKNIEQDIIKVKKVSRQNLEEPIHSALESEKIIKRNNFLGDSSKNISKPDEKDQTGPQKMNRQNMKESMSSLRETEENSRISKFNKIPISQPEMFNLESYKETQEISRMTKLNKILESRSGVYSPQSYKGIQETRRTSKGNKTSESPPIAFIPQSYKETQLTPRVSKLSKISESQPAISNSQLYKESQGSPRMSKLNKKSESQLNVFNHQSYKEAQQTRRTFTLDNVSESPATMFVPQSYKQIYEALKMSTLNKIAESQPEIFYSLLHKETQRTPKISNFDTTSEPQPEIFNPQSYEERQETLRISKLNEIKSQPTTCSSQSPKETKGTSRTSKINKTSEPSPTAFIPQSYTEAEATSTTPKLIKISESQPAKFNSQSYKENGESPRTSKLISESQPKLLNSSLRKETEKVLETSKLNKIPESQSTIFNSCNDNRRIFEDKSACNQTSNNMTNIISKSNETKINPEETSENNLISPISSSYVEKVIDTNVLENKSHQMLVNSNKVQNNTAELSESRESSNTSLTSEAKDCINDSNSDQLLRGDQEIIGANGITSNQEIVKEDSQKSDCVRNDEADQELMNTLPLTGDPEIDEEIIAFYRAKRTGSTY